MVFLRKTWVKKHEEKVPTTREVKHALETFEKSNLLFFENKGEVGCNMSSLLVNLENAESYKQSTIF